MGRLRAGGTRRHPVRLVPFLLDWVADDLPPAALGHLLRQSGPAYAVFLRLVRPLHERAERRTFRYA